MRVAHISDIHWQLQPRFKDLLSFRRLLGTLNLYLGGRGGHFSSDVQRELVAHCLRLKPDVVVISGDLTAQGTEAEFVLARRMLDPLLASVPTLVIPGNHDAYAADTVRGGWMNRYFQPWRHMHGSLGRLDVGSVTSIGLDPNRPQWLLANGEIPEEQLTDLADLLNGDDLKDHVILTLHYPVVDRSGVVYNGRKHGLLNAERLMEVLAAAKRKPDMVLHGHVHHGYRAVMHLGGAEVPTYDCGASGYAYLPELRRCASMNMYTFAGPGQGHRVDRYQYNGTEFAPEEGGAYATGR